MAAGAAPGRLAEQEAAVEAPAEEEEEEAAAAAAQSFKELVRGGRSRCRSLPQLEGRPGPGGAAGAGGGHVRGGAALPAVGLLLPRPLPPGRLPLFQLQQLASEFSFFPS